MERKPVIIKKSYSSACYFAYALTSDEYQTLKSYETDNEKNMYLITLMSIPNVNIRPFGNPKNENIPENYFKEYIEEKYINNVVHNSRNFFTSNKTEDCITWMQSDITSKRFIEEIINFFNKPYVVIFSTTIKLTNIEDKYYDKSKLIRTGYSNN